MTCSTKNKEKVSFKPTNDNFLYNKNKQKKGKAQLSKENRKDAVVVKKGAAKKAEKLSKSI